MTCRLAVTVVAALAATLTACGIAVDSTPRAIEAAESSTTTTTMATQEPGAYSTDLYFVHEGVLMPVRHQLADRSLDTELDALVHPPQELTDRYGLTTSIPAGTTILDVERNGTHMTVDLSEEFDKVVGLSRQQAIGQIVLTVTGLSGIASMSFEIDDEALGVASPARGDRSTVTACDYASLLATADEAIDAGLPAASVQRLGQRQEQLADCDPDD